jgi:signal transduction histidine kinase
MKQTKIKLLYIDDEQHNLDALRASYRREWEIYTALNGEQAEEILENNEITVIMSDHLMPGRTGVELLETFAEKYPQISRILITAHAQTPLIAKAVNKGKINYFLEKPWNNETLKQAVLSCHNIYLMNKAIKEKNRLLVQAHDELSRFIYSASHEMRSPLMSIKGLVELVLDEYKDEQLTEYLHLMNQSVDDVDSYVQAIIEFYKNAQVGSRSYAIDFETLLDTIVDEYGLKNKLNIKLNIKGKNQKFYTDPMRLKIALGNLFSNAAAVKEQSNNEINVVINVSSIDTVIEISEDNSDVLYVFIENVFKFFFNSGKSDDPVANTNIMSLFLFKDSLQKINGTIELKKKGKATTYLIKIPSNH